MTQAQQTLGGSTRRASPRTAAIHNTAWGSAHANSLHARFKVDAFDFFFAWIMGAQTHAGSETGELLVVASHIKDGDPETWIRSFTDMAERVETRGKASLQNGHVVSGRESLLRASEYFRAAWAFVSPIHAETQARELAARARSCFRQAGTLFDPPIESIDLPFEGQTLPVYIQEPDCSRQKRKTLLMIGGGDTVAEDLWYYLGPAALKRGYTFVTADLPGQGYTPFDGLFMRGDTETPMGAILDWVLLHPGVDSERLAAFGISGGGYFVPRAAIHDARLKAIIAFSLLFNVGQAWEDMLGAKGAFLWADRHGFVERGATLGIPQLKIAEALFDGYKWKYGVREIEDLVERSRDWQIDPTQITCPTQIMCAQKEYEQIAQSHAWQDEGLARISNPNKRLVIMPHTEDADGHCSGTNLSLVAQTAFDWLDEVFDGSSTR